MPFRAIFFDGETARRHEVMVAVAQLGLRIRHANGVETLWPWAEFKLAADGFAGDPLRFERAVIEGAGPALVVHDHAILAVIGRANPAAAKGYAAPATVGSFLATAAGAAVGAGALLVVMFMWGVPAIGSAAAAMVPVAWERELGKGVVAELVPPGDRCEDPARLASLQAIVNRLAAARPKSAYRYHVTLSNDEAVNAYAAPGGYIVVNAGLLGTTKRPEELAGILAHEIQHVEQRHTTKGICREFTMSAILRAVTGGSTFGTVGSAAKTLGALSYSRDAEEEADRQGMRLMRDAAVDPRGMVAAFEMLDAEGGGLQGALAYLSTHPRTADRIAILKRLAAKPMKPVVPLKLATTWKRVISKCGY